MKPAHKTILVLVVTIFVALYLAKLFGYTVHSTPHVFYGVFREGLDEQTGTDVSPAPAPAPDVSPAPAPDVSPAPAPAPDVSPAPAPSSNQIALKTGNNFGALRNQNAEMSGTLATASARMQAGVKKSAAGQNRATRQSRSGAPSLGTYMSEKQKAAMARLEQGAKDVVTAKGLQAKAAQRFIEVERRRGSRGGGAQTGRAVRI
jgi:hypothetical protein